jgi:hypothetical protein
MRPVPTPSQVSVVCFRFCESLASSSAAAAPTVTNIDGGSNADASASNYCNCLASGKDPEELVGGGGGERKGVCCGGRWWHEDDNAVEADEEKETMDREGSTVVY